MKRLCDWAYVLTRLLNLVWSWAAVVSAVAVARQADTIAEKTLILSVGLACAAALNPPQPPPADPQ